MGMAGLQSWRPVSTWCSSPAMLKPELTLRITARHPHLSEKEVARAVNTILGQISHALVAGDRVELRGLGAFSVKTRDAYEVRNPKTGALVSVREKKTVAFKPGRAMHARLNASTPPALLRNWPQRPKGSCWVPSAS